MDIDESLRNEFQDLFCRYLVGLAIWYIPKDANGNFSNETHFKCYSGTILSIDNVWFYLTAGHILKEIEEALKSNQSKIVNTFLIDSFGFNRQNNFPIPFDYLNSQKLYSYDDYSGLDFGLLLLSPLVKEHLLMGGVYAISEEDCQNDIDQKDCLCFMVGLPKELTKTVKVNHGDSEWVNGSVNATFVSITKIDEKPGSTKEHEFPEFSGVVPKESCKVESIVGMSGGPIIRFATDLSGHRVVAIQSHWNKEKRVTYGCKFNVITKLIHEELDKYAKSQS